MKRGDYRVEVFRGRDLLAWSEFMVGPDGTECDTFHEPSPMVILAVYDLLLLMALNVCPFPLEEKWLKNRANEHARLDPEAFRREYERRHPRSDDNGANTPW